VARFSASTAKCAQKEVDTADIVREGIYQQLRFPLPKNVVQAIPSFPDSRVVESLLAFGFAQERERDRHQYHNNSRHEN